MESQKLRSGTVFRSAPNPLYFIQRLLVQKRLRKWVAASLAAYIRWRRGPIIDPDGPSAAGRYALTSLLRFGYAPLQALLDPHQVAAIHSYLKDKILVDRDDAANRFVIDAVPAGVTIADYLRSDILACPHVLELANRTDLLQLAASYIGCKPTVSALLLRWSFPGEGPGENVQAFHRDADDWRFVKIFVYLTDVDPGAGPHVYVRSSHHLQGKVRLKSFSDDAVARRFGPDMLTVVTGAAGFGFAADTYGVHKGMVPRERPRLMLQIQYSLLPVYAYQYAPEPYQGTLALDPYINRLMLTVPSVAPSGLPA